MAGSLGQVGSTNMAAAQESTQVVDSAAQKRKAELTQQVFSRTSMGSEQRTQRQVALVEASKGQHISINA